MLTREKLIIDHRKLETSHVSNIKTLFNFDPPVTPEVVRAASL